jgi:hypothetical protein
MLTRATHWPRLKIGTDPAIAIIVAFGDATLGNSWNLP